MAADEICIFTVDVSKEKKIKLARQFYYARYCVCVLDGVCSYHNIYHLEIEQ